MNISDRITMLAGQSIGFDMKGLEDEFLNAQIGLVIQGIPDGVPGQKIIAGPKDRWVLQYVSDPNGKKMIKGCADPEIFVKNYNEKINAIMTGRELIEMTLKTDAEGILVCSATSFNSWPVYRDQARKMVAVRPKRKWFQF